MSSRINTTEQLPDHPIYPHVQAIVAGARCRSSLVHRRIAWLTETPWDDGQAGPNTCSFGGTLNGKGLTGVILAVAYETPMSVNLLRDILASPSFRVCFLRSKWPY